MRDGSAAGQMSAKSKFNRHLLAQTQARQASQEKSHARDRWSILKEVYNLKEIEGWPVNIFFNMNFNFLLNLSFKNEKKIIFSVGDI